MDKRLSRRTTLVAMNRARTPAAALFRRVFFINGLIFTLGTLILALSPATVSARIKLTEIPVLVVGLAVMLTANALLLRSSLAPLDRLAASMRRVDPPRRSDRVDDRGNGDLHNLITSFNAMLDRLETERTTASASALAAQENERQRIARELHDEIGQTLTVALLTLKRAVDRAPTAIRGELADTQETVRASLDEVRGIARRLRPDALEDLGLHSALNALCSEFTQATGIAVVKHVAPQSDRLKPDVELVCYRIAQESLTNVARHAGAGKVWLDLHATADQVTLRIADDGVGGVTAEGAGINGMRERALLVNADLTITSPDGEGTEVRLVIPARRTGRLMLAQPARILLADDHALVRSGLRMILDAEPDLHVVAEAADGHEALAALDHTPTDLAILDIAMPRMTGLQAAREMNRTHPHVRILILSMYDNEQYFFEALKAGASGLRAQVGGRPRPARGVPGDLAWGAVPVCRCGHRADSRLSTPRATGGCPAGHHPHTARGRGAQADRRGSIRPARSRPPSASAPRRWTGIERTRWPSSAFATDLP